VATKLTVAFVCPTPPSTYALQSIERPVLTVHEGVPDVRCELPGAFAELKLSAVGVYVPGATAQAAVGNAKATTNAVAMASSRRVFFTWISFCGLGLTEGAMGQRTPPRLTDASSSRIRTAMNPLSLDCA
jgi:hypothetical protein